MRLWNHAQGQRPPFVCLACLRLLPRPQALKWLWDGSLLWGHRMIYGPHAMTWTCDAVLAEGPFGSEPSHLRPAAEPLALAAPHPRNRQVHAALEPLHPHVQPLPASALLVESSCAMGHLALNLAPQPQRAWQPLEQARWLALKPPGLHTPGNRGSCRPAECPHWAGLSAAWVTH